MASTTRKGRAKISTHHCLSPQPLQPPCQQQHQQQHRRPQRLQSSLPPQRFPLSLLPPRHLAFRTKARQLPGALRSLWTWSWRTSERHRTVSFRCLTVQKRHHPVQLARRQQGFVCSPWRPYWWLRWYRCRELQTRRRGTRERRRATREKDPRARRRPRYDRRGRCWCALSPLDRWAPRWGLNKLVYS